MEWLSANIANIVILGSVIAVVVLIIIGMIRGKKAGKSSCGCGCSHCAMAGKCHPASKTKKT